MARVKSGYYFVQAVHIESVMYYFRAEFVAGIIMAKTVQVPLPTVTHLDELPTYEDRHGGRKLDTFR